MLLVLTAILVLVIIIAAFMALESKKLVMAVIAAGLVSLISSIVYVLLAAPDVAMTEAAIGSGLSTIMFLYVLRKVKGGING
jgi:energy-converting hydrogenase B subunit D